MPPASRSPPGVTTSRTRASRRSLDFPAAGTCHGDRAEGAAVAARRRAAERHPGARPRLRRHPHRRRAARDGEHLAGGALGRLDARRLRQGPGHGLCGGRRSDHAPRRGRQRHVPPGRFPPTGLIGVFGCTLAAGTLMGLTPEALVMAQGIALSMGSGSLEFLEDGAWTKRMHPGWAAQSGITAAALAHAGFVGPARAYEGRFGLFNIHLQEGIAVERWDRATAGLGTTWETSAVAVKPLPACHFTHACVDAAMQLKKQHRFDVDDIVRIKALVPAEVVKTVCEPLANKRRPANAYDAQFSIPYLVAASLVRVRFTLAELEPDALKDEAILTLCDRVDYEVDQRSTFPRHYTGEVQISLTDGRVLVHREAMNRGCADRPLSNAHIVQKIIGRRPPQPLGP